MAEAVLEAAFGQKLPAFTSLAALCGYCVRTARRLHYIRTLNAKKGPPVKESNERGRCPRVGGRRIPDEMQNAISARGAVMGFIDLVLMTAVKVGSTSVRAIRRMAQRMRRLGHVAQAG